jgi:hypothetical protein
MAPKRIVLRVSSCPLEPPRLNDRPTPPRRRCGRAGRRWHAAAARADERAGRAVVHAVPGRAAAAAHHRAPTSHQIKSL